MFEALAAIIGAYVVARCFQQMFLVHATDVLKLPEKFFIDILMIGAIAVTIYALSDIHDAASQISRQFPAGF